MLHGPEEIASKCAELRADKYSRETLHTTMDHGCH